MPSIFKTIILTSLALIAFAANSVLCRLALGEPVIDAASFTIIRLLSGAVVLSIIVRLNREQDSVMQACGWLPAVMLFLYAVCFSYAYITLDTGTGALILFGAVQVTMIIWAIVSGQRLHFSEYIGVMIAFTGFAYLFLPGLTTPSLFGFVLMAIAGIAWGVYTLQGKGSLNPLLDTARNFLRTLPFVIILTLTVLFSAHLSWYGILLAVLSGAVASGIGYAVWYQALGSLTATQAAVVQLLVPVIAALGGLIFAGEAISLRLLISAIMILGGILIVVLGRYYFIQRNAMA